MKWVIIALCFYGDPFIIEYDSYNHCETERKMLVESGLKCDFRCVRVR